MPGAPDLDGVAVVVVRLLGGRRSWEAPFDALRRSGVPLIAVGGESVPDAELAALSTVPAGVAAEVHRYLAAGGPANLEHCLRFVADTVLLGGWCQSPLSAADRPAGASAVTQECWSGVGRAPRREAPIANNTSHLGGFGFDPPTPLPMSGVFEPATTPARRPGRPLVGVVFYRAHLVAGNTTFVEDLSAALDAAGGDCLAVYCYSLRPDADGRVPALELCRERGVDVLVTTVLAMGGTTPTDPDAWSVPQLAGLGAPVVQAPSCNRSRDDWLDDDAGLSPLDVAMGVAIPEFDGRIVGPAFAFKEEVDDGGDLGVTITATRADPERARRVARLALRLASLRHKPAADKRVAVVLSAYPTKRSRLGNAVGLDSPASAIHLLHALRDAGYRVDRIPADGDSLMAELADRLTYDSPALTPHQAAATAGRLPAAEYVEWYSTLPDDARSVVEHVWGPAPGEVYVHDQHLCLPGLDLGGVLVAIQPPRGFGSDPIGTYHAPDVPPPHHYLAFYRWLDVGWGADAVVHLGKHGTLEWLPGKANALSASCFPDAALADLPLVYPFIVNDPGEGTQAKRRAHAVVVDHLVPPMTRAETYDDLARLEHLLDAYASAQAMDPAKLPVLRRQVWDLLVEAEIHRDLGLGGEPAEDEFADVVLHVDGYLCALKDAQIRGGLHVLGQPPAGDALVDLVLAVTRLPQGTVPSLRATVAAGLNIDLAAGGRTEVDAVEAEARRRVEGLAAAGWTFDGDDPTLRWVAERLIPALHGTTDEIANVLAALDGRYVPAGPSGSPTRGGAHVLPTGRNFYSVDPKALPSPVSWEVGCKLADAVIARHIDEEGAPPRTVGIVLWGTAAMRTGGDDAAEALALLGVRPVWEPESRRVAGLEVVPLSELGRPRVDVTLRISGFFRDAFPHLVALLDDAVRLVAALVGEPAADNPVRDAGDADARIFGPPPGGYGSGILPVIEKGSWRTDADLADVYLQWSGFSYRRGAMGRAEPEAMRRRFAAIEIAVKNQDNREHDIFDSDDYLQDHGGMVAAVRALTGRQPHAWFGDTANPLVPQVRALAEEAARVVRSRVLNPRWIEAMRRHGYKGAFELAATVDYLFGYDATTGVVQDWMYERVTDAYVADPDMRAFFAESNPWALRAIAERLLEAGQRGMWSEPSDAARKTLEDAVLEAEGWEESRT
ncbi:MAG: cobaltochelatase subunit CobN [Acidimicrobiales bacterium]